MMQIGIIALADIILSWSALAMVGIDMLFHMCGHRLYGFEDAVIRVSRERRNDPR